MVDPTDPYLSRIESGGRMMITLRFNLLLFPCVFLLDGIGVTTASPGDKESERCSICRP
jgi:hypothetical protein